MYALGMALGAAVGARIGMFLGVFAFGMGALLLRPVREPPRVRGGDVPTGSEGVAAQPA
jgi:hypothetical protein